MRHQQDCMGCWKASLLLSKESCFTASHCASLCPQYFSSGSSFASVSLSSFFLFFHFYYSFPTPNPDQLFQGLLCYQSIEHDRSNLEVVLYIYSLIEISTTLSENFGILIIPSKKYDANKINLLCHFIHDHFQFYQFYFLICFCTWLLPKTF